MVASMQVEGCGEAIDGGKWSGAMPRQVPRVWGSFVAHQRLFGDATWPHQDSNWACVWLKPTGHVSQRPLLYPKLIMNVTPCLLRPLSGPHAGEKRSLDVQGMFYGIGHTPNSKLVAGQVRPTAGAAAGGGG
mgnify:CR=1 FL=1